MSRAGGFIVQLMPFADEDTINRLEGQVGKISSVTALLDQGSTPEMLLDQLLAGMGPEITEKTDVRFFCNCGKERVSRALISVGRKELEDMIREGKPVKMNCHFCNTSYTFSVEEIKELYLQC